MIFLKSIFRLREKAQIQHQQPDDMNILDHLEDLRRTIIRIAITLIVSMLVCFSFAPTFMDILKGPVDAVWLRYEEEHLPAEIDADDWIEAKHVASVLVALPDRPRELLLRKQRAEVLTLLPIVPILNAAALVPQGEREAYIRESLTDTPEVAQQALALQEKGAVLRNPRSREALQLMGAFHPAEAFMLSLTLSFFGGIILAFPLLMYFVLQFIVPGLHQHEKRLLYKSVFWGFGLFIAGCSFAYYIVLPRVLSFFYSYALSLGISNDWRIGDYISFAIKLVCVFGAVFELPVLVIPFVKLGVLSYDLMKRTRAYALIACLFIALLLAPAPDPGTMLIMAAPMYLLYELCILYAWYENRSRARQAREEEENTPDEDK